MVIVRIGTLEEVIEQRTVRGRETLDPGTDAATEMKRNGISLQKLVTHGARNKRFAGSLEIPVFEEGTPCQLERFGKIRLWAGEFTDWKRGGGGGGGTAFLGRRRGRGRGGGKRNRFGRLRLGRG
jgi:hypothetical protein